MNRNSAGGVLLPETDERMQEYTDRLAVALVDVEEELKREFELRLRDSSTLAFRVAYSVLRHAENAEDVAQEALARAYSKFRRLRDRDRFRAWLTRMTWRLAIDRQRADRRRAVRESVPQAGSGAESPVEAVIAQERAARLWRAIDALPEKLRLTVVLAGIEQHDIREVALLLGLPEGTVKSRLFLARQRLKELLQ
ncbi:MAG TPA: RNA polymerase sigma factor [Terriglobia bacterium]|nr:RNA polymerase sigma factor [Terriglobia bacterium]